MGQIKNIKLHIVTDIKVLDLAINSNNNNSNESSNNNRNNNINNTNNSSSNNIGASQSDEMSKTEAREWIKAKLDENKVVVFSKSSCPFCHKAKKALEGMWDYLWIEIENMPNMDAVQDVLKEMTGARSVPRVFVNKECIGGGDETDKMKRSGELEK